MSKKEVPVFETTMQKTREWLKELSQAMQWEDHHLSYIALRAVLHALRDRLPVETAASLGAQLPMLIRGIYYEGWVPAHTPIRIHHTKDFLGLVEGQLSNQELYSDPRILTEEVFRLLAQHVSLGEIDHLKSVLPRPIAALFPVTHLY